ncbi:MATE family efflux transporter [Bradyrhizobium sp. 182]|uniref:MATE family efflux transporter n=1 Tax=Bradyrhizobium sp. 182 TaxID=2782651 RepID=UPI0031F8696E
MLKGGLAPHRITVELSETAKLALPIVVTQFGQLVMITTDLAFISRIDTDALAAAALASRTYLVSFTFGTGLLAPIAALAAQAFGSNNLAIVRRSLRMGLWMALLLSFPITAVLLKGEQILLALGQAPNTARLAQQYLFGLAWGVAPMLCFQVIRNFMTAVNRPEPISWITVSAIPINALLLYVLIYGKLSLPRLGLFGAGLATTLVNCGMVSAGLWFAARQPSCDYHVLARFWRFDWPAMRHLIVIGTPISIASLIGYGTISAATFQAGLIGTGALAAHQIALQIATTLFLIALAISVASAVRVGQAVGRNDWPGVDRAGLAAILLGIGVVATLAIIVILARFEIAEFFLGSSTGGVDRTIGLAATLLSLAAWFFVSDTIAIIAAGALRGLRDTRVPLLFASVSYWGIGFSLSYVLGFKTSLGVFGIWIGLSTGTTIYAGLLVVRFRLLTHRLAPRLRP